jgi:hypothetical protein
MRRGEPQVPKDLARLSREELVKLATDLVRHLRVQRAQIRSLKRDRFAVFNFATQSLGGSVTVSSFEVAVP